MINIICVFLQRKRKLLGFFSEQDQYFIYGNEGYKVIKYRKRLVSKLQRNMSIEDINKFISLKEILEQDFATKSFGYLVSDYIPDIKNDKSK